MFRGYPQLSTVLSMALDGFDSLDTLAAWRRRDLLEKVLREVRGLGESSGYTRRN